MLTEPSRSSPGAEATQSAVDRYFDQSSAFWDELYGGTDVYSAIHRRRQQLALAWIDELGPPGHGRALELGCGAGLTAIALARRGWHVHATDTVESMLARARANAAATGVEDRITFGLADAQRLTFGDASFDLVLALGVIPWLELPACVWPLPALALPPLAASSPAVKAAPEQPLAASAAMKATSAAKNKNLGLKKLTAFPHEISKSKKSGASPRPRQRGEPRER